ncbi:MAG: hypothetical protein AAGD06_07410 [Acidobacteriota bacterium]
MRLDVFVHTQDGPVPGEISTEISEGEPVFVPWSTTQDFVQGQPYPLADFSGETGAPFQIELIHPKQLPLAKALDVAGCRFFSELTSSPPKDHRRAVSVNLEKRQVHKLKLLARRDGISNAAWIRSLVERELHLRRMA